MRISDWSSDVCSSDLDAPARQHAGADLLDEPRVVVVEVVAGPGLDRLDAERLARAHAPGRHREELGVGLAVDAGKGIAPPVARLGQVLLLGGPDLQAAEPVDRGRIGRASGRGRGCHYREIAGVAVYR